MAAVKPIEADACTSENVRFLQAQIGRLQREISGSDRFRRSRYIQDFHREFETYEANSSHRELLDAAAGSDIILIGDYHTLEAYQLFAADFVSRLFRRGRRLLLGLEVFYGRNQRALDQWMARAISDEDLRQRVDYELEWGYPWGGTRAILETARARSISVYGLDCPPRNDPRMIRARDRCVAARIAEMTRRRADHRIVVIYGEAHLAAGHLPSEIQRQLAEGGLRRRLLTIVQNQDAIYWKLACDGRAENKVVRVRHDAYCVMSANPYLKYESYYRQLERWKSEQIGEPTGLHLTASVHHLIDTIANFVGIRKQSYCLSRETICLEFFADAYPEVHLASDKSVLKQVLTQARLTRAQAQQILSRVAARGSCYVAAANAVLVGEFQLEAGAEEAARFVNYACKGERLERFRQIRRSAADLFYVQVMEACLGYFGSKLLVPSRRPARRESLEGLSADEQRALRLGYRLGEKLYDGYLAGKIGRRQIASLFFNSLSQPGEAEEMYRSTNQKLRITSYGTSNS